MRRALLILLFSTGCAITPPHVLDLADAESDSDIDEAAEKARGYLRDGNMATDVRCAAAKTLGRLRRASPEVIESLGNLLNSQGENEELRAFIAWALGELRSEGSLEYLVKALRTPLDAKTGAYVLEGIAKHESLMSRDQERLVQVVEALVYFSGNQEARAPAIYDVLGERTRTLPVNVKVLKRSIELAAKKDPRAIAAMYDATYELLDRLERSRAELLASGASKREEIRAAVEESLRAFHVDDARTKLLAIWYFGRLSDLGDVSSTAANALAIAKGPVSSESSPLRFVTAWTLARIQLGAPGPRQTLARDVLPKEIESAILDLLANLYTNAEDYDEIQKIVGETP